MILPNMFDEESGLFSHKTLLRGDVYENRRTNALYSAIAVVGTLKQRHTDPGAVFPVGRALDGLYLAARESANPSLIGTALWAMCLAEDRRGTSLIGMLEEALHQRRSSMELGLTLTGL